MSFKRDGDDPGQLGVLQRRRVADLLANYIPEDEALLMRSGRFSCTVCPHRPIFDTLDVLMVHRAGKKHTSNLQRFYGRKLSLQDVAQKQRPEEVQAEEEGSPAPLLARTRRIARSALLKAAPYSSCCRRNGVEGSSSGAGTTRVGLRDTGTTPEHPKAADASPATLLPGHRGGPADTPKVARPRRGSKGKTSSSGLSQPDSPTPERRRALERYLQLRSAGWIQDLSGRWVKDENAEFDSDEDEPPLMPASDPPPSDPPGIPPPGIPPPGWPQTPPGTADGGF